MFAPLHHSAMKHAIGPRREMGVRTVFNLLGPLTNPAGAPSQVIGVFAREWLVRLAETLGRLGSRHVLVVHAEDGLDEISIGAVTHVAEMKQGMIDTYTITPEQFGLQRAAIGDLVVENPQQSLVMIRAVLDNHPGAARDIVALNAGAAIYAADIEDTLASGIENAKRVIASGAARAKLEQFIRYTNEI